VFIERALIVHAGLYDYSLTVYGRNNASKVKIVCPVHGVFLQRPANHLNGAGCLSCMNSRGEVAIYKWLKAHFLEFEQQKHFVDCINPHDRSRRGRLKFDFYIVSSNLLIEYDGEQHFGLSLLRGVHRQTEDELQENQLRDDIKTQYAHSKGITLLRINFKQFSLITKLLTDALLGTGLIKEDKEAIGTI
jgi:very-short-patch-repair endonuclease